MSIETQIAALTAAAEALTSTVANKQSEIDEALATALGSFVVSAKSKFVRVGVGGDFETLAQALNFYGSVDMVYTSGARQLVTLELQAGYVLKEQILMYEGKDLSFVRITSVDPVVYVDHTSIVTSFWGRKCIVGVAAGGRSPSIETLFELSPDISALSAVIDGVFAREVGSIVRVSAGCGVRNATGHGINVERGAFVLAISSDFSSARVRGINAAQGATVCASYGDFSNAGSDSVYAASSNVVVDGANLKKSKGRGIYAYSNAFVSAVAADVSDVVSGGVFAYQACVVNFRSGVANRVGGDGVKASEASMINAHAVNADDVLGCAFYSATGSMVSANSSKGRNAGVYGAVCEWGASLGIEGSDLTGYKLMGVLAQSGSSVNARSSNIALVDAVSSDDIKVLGGSVVAAHGAIGASNIAKNTLTSSGILFAN
ncbi:hypothetical protein [Marinomonas shanghaiensis]|uniref:hypothetical protein n=1 Tax=Marinomonas shanghaiensis TaxID=2202418 RepID=UPI003A8E7A1F